MTDEEKRGGDKIYRMLSQDLYATDMHGDEVGIRQDEVWRAKSRQFTKDAEIIGKIMEAELKDDEMPDLEKSGFIILRNSLWNEEDEEIQRRLVVKLFTDSGGWIATIEEMIAESYNNSYTSGEPLLTFAVITKDHEIVTYIRQMNRGKITTENYGFYILGPDNTFEVFRIEGKRASFGDDYRVIMIPDETVVAEIDSKFGDVGGEFVVKIKDKILADNDWFCRVLQCFSVMALYRVDMRKYIDNGLKKWLKGDEKPPIHRYETSLLANPRKLTLSKEEYGKV